MERTHALSESESCTASNSQCKPHEKKYCYFIFSYFLILFLISYFIVNLISHKSGTDFYVTICMLCFNLLLQVWLFVTLDCSQPGSSVRGILQARVVKLVPFPLPGSCLTQGLKHIPCIGRRVFGVAWVDKMFLVLLFYYIFMFIHDLYLISDKHQFLRKI